MFGLTSWLIGRGIAGWLAPLIVYGILAALAAGVFFGIRHYILSEWNLRVAEPYRVEGDERTKAILVPKLEEQTKRADLAERRLEVAINANKQLTEDIEGPGGLRDQVKVAEASVTKFEKLAAQARATTKRLLAEIAAQARRDAAELEALRVKLVGPPLDFAAACQEADKTLADLAAWVRR